MAGTKVENAILASGQNEGIENAILPMPQMRSIRNMRQRKGARWGKRFGHTALSTTNLGNGTGAMRAVGGARSGSLTCFALVDDKCSIYDQTAGAFVAPSSFKNNAASGWVPDTSFFPVPPISLQYQTKTPCASCYAFGYLWTAIQFTDLNNPTDQRIRLVATDPTDQTVVRIDDFTATTVGFGGNAYPRLILVGSTLILTYALTVAATTNVTARSLANIGATWSAESSIAQQAGLIYDASSYDSTRFVVAFCSPAASGVTLITAAFAASASAAIVDASGNPLTSISVVGAGSQVYVGFGVGAITTTRVLVYTTNLAGVVGTATLTASFAQRPLLGLVSGGVRVVRSSRVVAGIGAFAVVDVSSLAIAGAANTFSNLFPISNPFAIGANVYMWTKTEISGNSVASQPNYSHPVLIKLTATGGYNPLEMSPQEYLVSNGLGLTETDLRGLPTVAQLGTTAAYAVPVPTLYQLASSISGGHDFRILQAKHFTDSAGRRSVPTVYADSSAFLPMGTLTRIDDRGALEAGFMHTPTVGTLTPAIGGGIMTPSSDYYYTAVYRSRNSNGRSEVSGPSIPKKVTMAVGQNQVTVSILSLGITARPNTTIEVYRTLSNGQTFYLAAVLDSGFGFVSYLDQISDTVIAAQQALYTQVGQTLANAFPPPSRFACVGGQRMFLGGLMRPDIVQASKLIFGDQSPSFTDSDAFRIVLPAPCTGIAWMDTLCMFTNEGIYIASGDGPDDSGIGDFGTLTRMPYELGCIEPRSVIVVDDGCFFQTARGLYMLPRGFGAPIPAGDNVMDSLDTFPIITSVAALTKSTEQSVYWTTTESSSTTGLRIVYDLAHKCWSIDSVGRANCGMGQWVNNELAVFRSDLAVATPLQVTNSTFDDSGTAISMGFSTGHIRPFGVLSEGAITKIQILADLRSACSVDIARFTEWGGTTSTRAFALAAGDYQVGQLTVTDIELSTQEAREAVRLQVQVTETSASEGLAFIALSLEHEQGEGLKRASPLSRVT